MASQSKYQRGLHLLCLALCLLLPIPVRAQATTVVLIRHGERVSLWDGDSPLSEAGLRRAEALVPGLAAFHPTVIFTSDRLRTQQTVAPLAAKLGLKATMRPKDASAALAAEILKDRRGQTVLVCWHHDLMKKLAKGLGVSGPIPYWSLDAYDPIWIIRVPAQGGATLEVQSQASAKPEPLLAK
jgi:phosphohistidine phosphatase SixA